MTLRALITRPEEDAAPLAAALADRGVEVTVEPLLTIRPLPEAPIELDGVQALLFTSANGVRALARLAGERNLAGWRDLPVYAVGNATAAAARDAGFTRIESAAGDVAALARLVAARLDPMAGPLFHAAGSAVAGDLAGLVEQAGFTLRRAVLYEAKPADQLSPSTVAALANGAFDLALFFSPRTAAAFVTLAQQAGDGVVNGCGRAAALCLSPAVAAAAGGLPWRAVEAAARPELPAMLELVDRALGVAPVAAAARQPADLPPAAEQAARHAPPPLPPRPRPRLIATALVAAVVAAAVAVGADVLRGWWAAPTETVVTPAPPDPATVAKLDRLAQQADAAASDLAAVKQQVAALADRAGKLQSELAGLQGAAPAPQPPPDLAPLRERIAALEAKLAVLPAQPAAAGAAATPAAADVERLAAENAQLRGDLATLRTQLEALGGVTARLDALDRAVAARPPDAGAAARVLAVSHLGAALATARPFAAELTALSELAAADPPLAAQVKELTAPFAGRAATGVPTLADLQARFPAAAKAIVDAAVQERAAAPAAGAGWFDRAVAWLSSAVASIVTVRPVGEVPGDDPAARVARAETRLGGGDLAAAVQQLTGLAGPAGDAAAPWLGDAEARLAADAAIAALQTAAAKRLQVGEAATGNVGN